MTNMQNNTDENFNEDFERLLKQFVSENTRMSNSTTCRLRTKRNHFWKMKMRM